MANIRDYKDDWPIQGVNYKILEDLYNRGIVKHKNGRGRRLKRPSNQKMTKMFLQLFDPKVMLTDIATVLQVDELNELKYKVNELTHDIQNGENWYCEPFLRKISSPCYSPKVAKIKIRKKLKSPPNKYSFSHDEDEHVNKFQVCYSESESTLAASTTDNESVFSGSENEEEVHNVKPDEHSVCNPGAETKPTSLYSTLQFNTNPPVINKKISDPEMSYKISRNDVDDATTIHIPDALWDSGKSELLEYTMYQGESNMDFVFNIQNSPSTEAIDYTSSSFVEGNNECADEFVNKSLLSYEMNYNTYDRETYSDSSYQTTSFDSYREPLDLTISETKGKTTPKEKKSGNRPFYSTTYDPLLNPIQIADIVSEGHCEGINPKEYCESFIEILRSFKLSPKYDEDIFYEGETSNIACSDPFSIDMDAFIKHGVSDNEFDDAEKENVQFTQKTINDKVLYMKNLSLISRSGIQVQDQNIAPLNLKYNSHATDLGDSYKVFDSIDSTFPAPKELLYESFCKTYITADKYTTEKGKPVIDLIKPINRSVERDNSLGKIGLKYIARQFLNTAKNVDSKSNIRHKGLRKNLKRFKRDLEIYAGQLSTSKNSLQSQRSSPQETKNTEGTLTKEPKKVYSNESDLKLKFVINKLKCKRLNNLKSSKMIKLTSNTDKSGCVRKITKENHNFQNIKQVNSVTRKEYFMRHRSKILKIPTHDRHKNVVFGSVVQKPLKRTKRRQCSQTRHNSTSKYSENLNKKNDNRLEEKQTDSKAASTQTIASLSSKIYNFSDSDEPEVRYKCLNTSGITTERHSSRNDKRKMDDSLHKSSLLSRGKHSKMCENVRTSSQWNKAEADSSGDCSHVVSDVTKYKEEVGRTEEEHILTREFSKHNWLLNKYHIRLEDIDKCNSKYSSDKKVKSEKAPVKHQISKVKLKIEKRSKTRLSSDKICKFSSKMLYNNKKTGLIESTSGNVDRTLQSSNVNSQTTGSSSTQNLMDSRQIETAEKLMNKDGIAKRFLNEKDTENESRFVNYTNGTFVSCDLSSNGKDAAKQDLTLSNTRTNAVNLHDKELQISPSNLPQLFQGIDAGIKNKSPGNSLAATQQQHKDMTKDVNANSAETDDATAVLKAIVSPLGRCSRPVPALIPVTTTLTISQSTTQHLTLPATTQLSLQATTQVTVQPRRPLPALEPDRFKPPVALPNTPQTTLNTLCPSINRAVTMVKIAPHLSNTYVNSQTSGSIPAKLLLVCNSTTVSIPTLYSSSALTTTPDCVINLSTQNENVVMNAYPTSTSNFQQVIISPDSSKRAVPQTITLGSLDVVNNQQPPLAATFVYQKTPSVIQPSVNIVSLPVLVPKPAVHEVPIVSAMIPMQKSVTTSANTMVPVNSSHLPQSRNVFRDILPKVAVKPTIILPKVTTRLIADPTNIGQSISNEVPPVIQQSSNNIDVINSENKQFTSERNSAKNSEIDEQVCTLPSPTINVPQNRPNFVDLTSDTGKHDENSEVDINKFVQNDGEELTKLKVEYKKFYKVFKKLSQIEQVKDKERQMLQRKKAQTTMLMKSIKQHYHSLQRQKLSNDINEILSFNKTLDDEQISSSVIEINEPPSPPGSPPLILGTPLVMPKHCQNYSSGSSTMSNNLISNPPVSPLIISSPEPTAISPVTAYCTPKAMTSSSECSTKTDDLLKTSVASRFKPENSSVNNVPLFSLGNQQHSNTCVTGSNTSRVVVASDTNFTHMDKIQPTVITEKSALSLITSKKESISCSLPLLSTCEKPLLSPIDLTKDHLQNRISPTLYSQGPQKAIHPNIPKPPPLITVPMSCVDGLPRPTDSTSHRVSSETESQRIESSSKKSINAQHKEPVFSANPKQGKQGKSDNLPNNKGTKIVNEIITQPTQNVNILMNNVSSSSPNHPSLPTSQPYPPPGINHSPLGRQNNHDLYNNRSNVKYCVGPPSYPPYPHFAGMHPKPIFSTTQTQPSPTPYNPRFDLRNKSLNYGPTGNIPPPPYPVVYPQQLPDYNPIMPVISHHHHPHPIDGCRHNQPHPSAFQRSPSNVKPVSQGPIHPAFQTPQQHFMSPSQTQSFPRPNKNLPFQNSPLSNKLQCSPPAYSMVARTELEKAGNVNRWDTIVNGRRYADNISFHSPKQTMSHLQSGGNLRFNIPHQINNNSHLHRPLFSPPGREIGRSGSQEQMQSYNSSQGINLGGNMNPCQRPPLISPTRRVTSGNGTQDTRPLYGAPQGIDNSRNSITEKRPFLSGPLERHNNQDTRSACSGLPVRNLNRNGSLETRPFSGPPVIDSSRNNNHNQRLTFHNVTPREISGNIYSGNSTLEIVGGSIQEQYVKGTLNCGACDQKALFVCSQCKKMPYCSELCQTSSWSKHAPNCLNALDR